MSIPNQQNKKLFFIFLILLVIITVLRATSLTEAMYDDESNFAHSLSVMDSMGINPDYHSPIPLNLIYLPIIAIFGLKIWVFRLIPLIFSVVNTLLIYYYTKDKTKNSGYTNEQSNNAAFFSGLLMLISFYPTLAALQFDVEGNLIMFCAILTFYLYDKSLISNIKKQSKVYLQILAGIILGIAIIAKQNAAIIAIIFLIYALIINFKNKEEKTRITQFKNYCKDSLILGISAVLTFSLSFLWTFLGKLEGTGGTSLDSFSAVISPDVGRYYVDHFSIVGPSVYLLWETPLLIGLFLLIFRKDFIKQHIQFLTLPLIWVISTLFFYTFVITFGAIDKYLMHTIPALAMVGGFVLANFYQKYQNQITSKSLFKVGIITLFTTAVFFIINKFPVEFIHRDISLYISYLKNLNPFFLFSYSSASGPLLSVSFITILLAFGLSFGFLAFYFLSKKHKNIFLACFLIIALSFNIFLVSEYLFHPTTVDVTPTVYQMIDYVEENKFNTPVYSNSEHIIWHFNNAFWHNYSTTMGFGTIYPYDEMPQQQESLQERGGTVILLHWLPIPEDTGIYELFEDCVKDEKKFYTSEGMLMGEIYHCTTDNS